MNSCALIKINMVCNHKKFERKIVNIFLPVSLNICFGCSKERSHLDVSFEYPQHVSVEKCENQFYSTHSYIEA